MTAHHYSSPRIRAAVLLSALAVILGVTPQFTAQASTDNAPESTCSTQKTDSARSALLAFRAADGQTAVDLIDARLRDLRDEGLSFDQSLAVVQSDLCLTPADVVSAAPVTTSSSTAGNVAVARPRVNYDSATRHYYAIGSWDWLNQGYRYDGTCTPYLGSCSKPQGGNDGFGIGLGSTMKMRAYSISVRGDCYYGWLTSRTPTTANGTGAGWELRDDVYTDNGLSRCRVNNYFDTQLAYGQEVITFDGTLNGGCRNVQAFSAFSHTWNHTSVTGISLGLDSVGFSWSTTSNYWRAASQPGNVYRVC